MTAPLPTSPAYCTEWDLVFKTGAYSYVVYCHDAKGKEIPNTVPTDPAMPQYDWYENLEIIVFFLPAQGGPTTNVASLSASVLRRDIISGRFGESMSLFVTEDGNAGSTSEMEEITLDFDFDDLLHFRRAQLDKIRMQGSGVWRDELNDGNLVIVESIFVDPPLWRRGLGRRMVQVLVDIVRQKGDCTILLRPVFLGKKTYDALERDMDGAQLTPMQKQEIAKASATLPLNFWQAQGFRRIGTTEWLGLSSNPAHPATLIPKDQDAELDMETTREH